MRWPTEEWNGMTIHRCAQLNHSGVFQAFSTQSCGNMALHTGDLREDVVRRRRQFLEHLGLDLRQLVAAGQVHGTRVQIVDSSLAGAGAESWESVIPETDALVTAQPGIVLGIFTADCLPIFLYDQETPVVAVIHAGWRGTIDRIVSLTLETMIQTFGTDPGRVWAAVGPGICRSCFQVDQDLAERFRRADPRAVTEESSIFHVDLAAFNVRVLENAGINPEQIVLSKLCTACNPEIFFSYRAGGRTSGRMMGIIGIR
jgi:YfiH family protein